MREKRVEWRTPDAERRRRREAENAERDHGECGKGEVIESGVVEGELKGVKRSDRRRVLCRRVAKEL